jgi:N-glycosylase/DNA lyase
MWGKEAGWAHSVLFTADLRAFSERLVEKIAGTPVESAAKVESNTIIQVELPSRLQASRKRAKRASEELQREEIIVEEDKFSKVKRRRRR